MGDTIGEVAFCSFLDDNGEVCDGYFEIVELTQTYVKLRTRGAVLIIPMGRVHKIKIKEDNNGK